MTRDLRALVESPLAQAAGIVLLTILVGLAWVLLVATGFPLPHEGKALVALAGSVPIGFTGAILASQPLLREDD